MTPPRKFFAVFLAKISLLHVFWQKNDPPLALVWIKAPLTIPFTFPTLAYSDYL